MAEEELGLATIHDVLAYLVSFRMNDFYARVVSSLPSRADSRVPFMGVMFERGHHILLYNPTWVDEKLNEGRAGFEELRATIAHEAMHVILCHISRQLKLMRGYSGNNQDEEFRRFCNRTNIATDMAANDLLSREIDPTRGGGPAYIDLKRNEHAWVLPKQFKFPEELTYEWYMTLLMDPDVCPQCVFQMVQQAKQQQQQQQQGQGPGKQGQQGQQGQKKQQGYCDHGKRPGFGQIIDPGKHNGAHEYWIKMVEELSAEEIEMLASNIEGDAYEKLKQAVEEHKRSRGTVPGAVEQQLEDMLKPPVIPWRKLLHQFVTRCRLSKPLRSLERPRKRWMNLGTTIYPGTKRDRTFHLYFAIDTSGSMSEEDLLEGLSELQGIQRVDRDVEVTVIEFDAVIHKEYKLTATGEVDVNLRGRGGTDFNAAFDRARELAKKGEVDAVIIYTDGYAPAPELVFRPRDVPVLWCLTEGGTHPSPGYGYEIRRPRT